MAMDDIYEIQWATQYDGAVANNSLYYKQMGAVDPGASSDEQALAVDFFESANGPWKALQALMSTQATVKIARVKRVSPTVGRPFDVTVLLNNSGNDIGAGFPSHQAFQMTWYADDEFDESVGNRLMVMGFTATHRLQNRWTGTAKSNFQLFSTAMKVFGTLASPTEDVWRLQHRTNTGSILSAVFYADAFTPFARPFITRMTNRRPALLS